MLKEHGGFKEEELVHCAGTGLIIDIRGEAKESEKPISIAFRADIDALEM